MLFKALTLTLVSASRPFQQFSSSVPSSRIWNILPPRQEYPMMATMTATCLLEVAQNEPHFWAQEEDDDDGMVDLLEYFAKRELI